MNFSVLQKTAYSELFSVRKEPHIYLEDLGQGLLAYTHYYDDSINYDLPNLDTYDVDRATVYKKVDDENDYFIEFWKRVSRFDYLELFDFLEYHFDRTKDQYRYLAILKSRIIRLLKSDNNRIEKAGLILDWINTKNILPLSQIEILELKTTKKISTPSVSKDEISRTDKQVLSELKIKLKEFPRKRKKDIFAEISKKYGKGYGKSTLHNLLKIN